MQRRHELLPGGPMGRNMHLWVYGHFGAPVLVFPSAAGMAHEWEAQGMVEALADRIHAGQIKLYCTESNVAEAWTRKDGDLAWRMHRHRAFEAYLLSGLVPYIREDCRTPGIRLAATGTSLGATYAANCALKYSSIFRYALCMSGRYDITDFAGSRSNPDVYFSNPLAYLPNLGGEQLERLRRETHVTLVCGQGAWEDGNIEETQALAAVLAAKGIPHTLDLWGHDVAHEWTWWRRQAVHHLSGYRAE